MGLSPLASQKLTGAIPRFCVVVPAYNEATQIGDVIRALRESLGNCGRLLVVADNCTDDTADIARKAGAGVIERNDPTRRGKGYALNFAVQELRADPPEVVIIVDADCCFTSGSPQIIASIAKQKGAPVQALNLVGAPRTGPALVALSNFAFLVKNLVRSRGLQRLGNGVTIQGTGVAIPWAIFGNSNFDAEDPVEDLGYTIELARGGIRVDFCESVGLRSDAASAEASVVQRTRWEQGFLRTALRSAPPLMAKALTTFSRHKFALAMHLTVPPLALLVLLSAGLLVSNVVYSVLAGSIFPSATFLACVSCFAISLILAWWMEGRETVSAMQLLKAPFYIAWKLPIYLTLLIGRKSGWVRTPRT